MSMPLTSLALVKASVERWDKLFDLGEDRFRHLNLRWRGRGRGRCADGGGRGQVVQACRMTPNAITPSTNGNGPSDDEGVEEMFADALGLLFSVPLVAITAKPGRIWSHEPTGIQVYIPLTAKDENWTLQADAIWLASIFLAEHLDVIEGGFNHDSVLELGSGSGLLGMFTLYLSISQQRVCPGLAIATRFPEAKVVLSDYPDEGIINTLTQNIKLNNLEERVLALPLDWNAPETLNGRKFATLVAADTLWISQLHLSFCQTLQESMATDANVHIIAGLHTGRPTLQHFLETASRQGLAIIKTIEYHISDGRKRDWVEDRPEETREDATHWLLYIHMKNKRSIYHYPVEYTTYRRIKTVIPAGKAVALALGSHSHSHPPGFLPAAGVLSLATQNSPRVN